MGRSTKNPCKHIVSFRVNEKERQALDKWAVDTGMTISTMMRVILYQMRDSFEENFFDAENLQDALGAKK